MKILTLILLMTLSFNSFSNSLAHYNILPGKYHKGGNLKALILSEEGYRVKVNYEIKKKNWVPVPSSELSGETTITLPEEFRDERGYLELEAVETMDHPEATLKFIGRTNLPDLENAYEVEVLAKNGKSKTTIIYHPQLPSIGWARIKVTFISNIGLLNGYQLIGELTQE